MFTTVLIANRGEIACRIIRTLDAMGIRSVAVYSDADRDAKHTQLASTAIRIGPADVRQSYLNIAAIIAAAKATGAEAIHPGYGFLAENAGFATACQQAGIVFIGPPISAIQTMGDKIKARAAVESRGVPTVPGIAEDGLSDEDLINGADAIGFPILIKPAAGGGGKGMHRVDHRSELPVLLQRARREAGAAFGDDTLFIERFVSNPRHIEVQVVADAHGTFIHLGERECSLQRRHQKIIEEAPSALLTPRQREEIGKQAVQTAMSVGYIGAGTVEFIVSSDQPDQPFFMEMNTRLQVEHPVTEMITGVDLVALQLRVAAGELLGLTQDDVQLDGHAIEARIYAEDPSAGFLPTGGVVLDHAEAVGDGVRTDCGIWAGQHVSTRYDPMLAKVIAHARSRSAAIEKLDAALSHTRTLGVVTNVEFLRRLLADSDVRAGNLDTGLVERRQNDLVQRLMPDDVAIMAALILWAAQFRVGHDRISVWSQPTGWRIGKHRAASYAFEATAEPIYVSICGTPQSASVLVNGLQRSAWIDAGDTARIGIDGLEWTVPFCIAVDDRRRVVWLSRDGDWMLREYLAPRPTYDGDATPTLESPMPGAVVAVSVADGDHVEPGQAVVTVEAMKMEHVVTTTVAGRVRLNVRIGDQVTRGQVLARVEPEEDE